MTYINHSKERELDSWENEGDAILTRGRFLTGFTTETERALKDLDTAGGHREERTNEGKAMKLLVGQQFVKRRVYKGGLVTYEITDTGRELMRGLNS